jgi:CheY-like chemotaxis protein
MGRILIIDDDPDMLETTSMVLELGGYPVLCSSNGPDGLRQAAATPDLALVLVDVRMDGMDGIEVLLRLKQENPELPAVMMTAYARDSVELEAYRLGAYTLVRKPFEPEQMLNLVARAMRRTPVIIAGRPGDGRVPELKAALDRTGHRAIVTRSPEESVRASQDTLTDIAVITADFGEGLLDSLRQSNPDLRFLYAVSTPPPAAIFARTPAARPSSSGIRG